MSFLALGVTIIIVNIIGTISNGAVIVLFIKKPKLRRTVTDKFLLNLMVAGVVTTLGSIAMTVLLFHSKDEHRLPNLVGILISKIAFVLSLLLVTLDRFLAVQLPLRYKDVMTTFRVHCLITLVWLICIAVTIVQIVTASYSNKTLMNLLEILVIVKVSLAFLGMFVLIAVNLVVFREVKRQVDFLISTTVSVDSNGNSREMLRQREVKSAHLCLAMVSSFTISWLPVVIKGILFLKGRENTVNPTDILSTLCALFVAINVAINPCLYVLLKEEVRNAMKKLFLSSSFCERISQFNEKSRNFEVTSMRSCKVEYS